MKKIVPVFFLLIACNAEQQDKSKQAAEEIIKADKDMSTLASQIGFHKALLEYATDDVVKPQDGESPLIGKAALEKYWSSKSDTKDISWEPYKAEAARSGDMGYTLGNWKLVLKDTVLYGNYYTVWRKMPGGKWKFSVDGGNNTPAPTH